MAIWMAFITGMIVGACLVIVASGVLSMEQEGAAYRQKTQRAKK